ncbi:MAG: hypothetical protein NDJ89_10955 [Oligoflexia bacterium]|nr:hypothetical protein [Oligoflexia bacterium]
MFARLSTVVFLSLLVANLAHARGGSDGTRGGGEVLSERDGTLRLRDLVDPSVCEMRTGAEMRAANPAIDQILEKISRLDWYFAAGLKYEITQLNICLTEGLIRLPERDRDSVIIYVPQGRRYQAAIRFLDSRDVYLSRSLYEGLSYEQDRAFLIIHEALHSFIPRHSRNRKEGIMAAVKTLSRVVEGQIRAARKLRADLNAASIEYPWTEASLAPSRAAVEFALAAPAEQARMLLASRELDQLFGANTALKAELLHPLHRGLLFISPATLVARLLAEGENPTELLEVLINPPAGNAPVTAFDPLLVALAFAADESPELLQRIMESSAARQGPNLFERMKKKSLKAGKVRIEANPEYALLGIREQESSERINALSVRPYSLGEENKTPAEVRGFLAFVVELAKDPAREELLARTVTRNDNFYAAFGIRELQAQLAALNAPIARERTYLAEALPALVQGFRIALVTQVTREAGPEAAEKLNQAIDWSRLGLSTELQDKE